MLLHERLYKKIGIRKIKDFLSPKILQSEDYVFPKNSMLFYYNPSDIIVPLDTSSILLNNITRPVIKTVFKYNFEPVMGTTKLKSYSEGAIISTLKKHESSFRYLKSNITKLNVNSRTLFIFSYNILNHNYRYPAHPLTLLYKWHNSFNTVITDLVSSLSSDRIYYLRLELPNTIPTVAQIRLYLKHMNKRTLSELPDYSYLTMLELFKFIHSDYRKDSLFSKIPEYKYDSIYLVLTKDNKTVTLSMGVLAGVLKDMSYETTIAKYDHVMVAKLFVIFLNRILLTASTSITEIDKEVKTNNIASMFADGNIDIPDVDPDKHVDVNAILEEDIPDNHDAELKALTKEIEDGYTSIEQNDVMDQDDIEQDDIETIEDVNKEIDTVATVVEEVTKLKDNKLVTKKEHDTIVKIVTKQDSQPSPYPGDNRTIAELQNVSSAYKQDDAKLADNPVVLDKSMNEDTIKAVKQHYIKDMYKADVVNTVLSLQNSGNIVEDYSVDVDEDILGAVETHTMKIRSLVGGNSTIRIRLPKIEEDGTFKMGLGTYSVRSQRADLPIRKISATVVSLSSYYGKVFISKAKYKKADIGFWVRKQLLKNQEVDKRIANLVLVSIDNVGVKLPTDYQVFSRYIKSFNYGNKLFYFEYKTRGAAIGYSDKDVATYEGNKYKLIGKMGKTPLVIDNKNIIYKIESGKYTAIGTIWDNININKDNGPLEYSIMKIYKEQLPVGLVLSYYIGLRNIVKIFKTKFHTVESNKRISLRDDQYLIRFKDIKYVITKDYGKGDLMLAGLASMDKITKLHNHNVFNSKSKFDMIWKDLKLPLLHTNEIKLMETMFVDPMTKNILEEMKEPVTYKGLLIRANELLQDDTYQEPNDISGMYLRGHERIAGMVYNELVNAIRIKNNRSFFGKSKLEMSPYTVMNKLNEDSNILLVDDINPIAMLKQEEDISYTGFGGRSEVTITKSARVMNASEIGIVSEASKDSGSVGVTAYLSANPNIKNSRGIVDVKTDKDLTWSNIMSTSSLLTPFATSDDTKRQNFISIMNAHIVPIKNSRVPYVRTGYEAVVPLRMDPKYVTTAQEDGVVTLLTKDNITVNYKKSGVVKYKLLKWTTKEESGSAYTHSLISNLSKGDKFITGDTILYDKLFFEPDIFNPKRVLYKMGTTVTVALSEEPQTHEDSASISSKLTKEMSTIVTKVKSYVMTGSDNITDIVKIGDKVKPSDILFTMIDSSIGDIDKLDKRTIEILHSLKQSSPKAKYQGKITNIKIYYNCEKDELSNSVKRVIKETDARLVNDTGYTGKVTSAYSIAGKPLLPGSMEIKIYIETNEDMGIGDKGIFGNQLKFTVGEVFKYDMKTEDGTNIEAIFSNRSIMARIVNSPTLIGTASMVLEKLADNAVNKYFS